MVRNVLTKDGNHDEDDDGVKAMRCCIDRGEC